VHALRKLHDALAPGGALVDTQPLSPRPPVLAGHERLGSLDMRDWALTIRAIDEQFAQALAAGLFEVTAERRFVVPDVFDDGEEFLEVVSGWRGTQIPPALARKIRPAAPPVAVEQEIRLRLLAKEKP
jgi:hypothetical protein